MRHLMSECFSRTIGRDILTTFIGEVRKGSEAQTNCLVIERIEFTKRGNMNNLVPKKGDVSFKGALRGNNCTQKPS
jgi:hypothetical protein